MLDDIINIIFVFVIQGKSLNDKIGEFLGPFVHRGSSPTNEHYMNRQKKTIFIKIKTDRAGQF